MLKNVVLFSLCFVGFLPLQVFAQQQDTTLRVIEFSLCKDVIEREPFETVSSFSTKDEQAWVFARIENDEGLRTVLFRWFFNDELLAEVPSKVGVSTNWRTYSTIKLKTGFWRVEISDSMNSIYKEIRFNVSE